MNDLKAKVLEALKDGSRADVRTLQWHIKGASVAEFEKACKQLSKDGILEGRVETKLVGANWLHGRRPYRRTVYSIRGQS